MGSSTFTAHEKCIEGISKVTKALSKANFLTAKLVVCNRYSGKGEMHLEGEVEDRDPMVNSTASVSDESTISASHGSVMVLWCPIGDREADAPIS
jgi:hypothetical protein